MRPVVCEAFAPHSSFCVVSPRRWTGSMEKPYVFCGCQVYPSASAGPKSKKSGWEWDIPTPRPKSKKISQSNPAFPNPKKFDMDQINKRYSENLYEPVNPPPLYGDEYRKPKEHDTASLDERMIDIPPEIDIITSDGLDGLDKPDPHDRGIDGDREWKSYNSDREDLYPKTSFTAGIRNQELPTHGETSSVRPLTNKSISFAPDVPPDDEEPATGADSAETAQQVPVHQASEVPPKADPEGEEAVPSTSKPSALQQLKAKAGAMKQKFTKISIPVKPKFNQWTNIKLTKGRGKPKPGAPGDVVEEVAADQKVPEQGGGGWTEPLSLVPEPDRPADAKMEIDPVEEYVNPNDPFDQFFAKSEPSPADADAAKKKAAEDLKKLKALDKEQRQREQEELKRLKAEEKLQKQKQAEEEKLEKQKQAEEERLRKEQEKVEREKQQEEDRRVKAEEKARKDQEQEEIRQKQEQEKLIMLQQQLDDYEQFENPQPPQHQQPIQQDQVQKTPDSQHQPHEPPAPEKTAFKDTVASFFGTSYSSKPSNEEAKTPEKKRKLPSFELPKFKRSKTPPSRGDQPSTSRFPWKGRSGPAENQLANQYKRELEDREAEATPEPQATLREPQILITQPSIESGSIDSSSIHATSSSSYPSYQLLDGVPEGGEVDETDTSSMTDRQRKYKENLDKFKRNLNTFGNRSKAIAAKTGRGMKTFGRGVKNFGVNAVQEVKAKQEAVRQRDAQKRAELAEAQEGGDFYQPANNNQKTIKFRFARRDNKHHSPRPVPAEPVEDEPEEEEEPDQRPPKAPRQPPRPPLSSRDSPKSYPVHERKNRKPPPGGHGSDDMDDQFLHRSQVLGRADRDWESPLDLALSRDQSEEPWGTASSRDSPPGSSMASSSIMNRAGRHGVLEEIDSDEFFLRERGISEGEDEEEVNRLLVQELRQAFRPSLRNALDEFDIQPSTSSPRSAPKKPPRKAPEVGSNFQTFPPERPKRSRRAPGYVSAYINENPEEAEMMDDMLESHEDNMEVIGAVPEDDDFEIDIRIAEDDEGIRRVKEELRKLDEALGDDDDGRYELVSDHPSKPERHKRKKIKHPPTPQAFYYNTIAANEWMRDLEDQVLPPGGDEVPQLEPLPVAPRRGKSKSENQEQQEDQGMPLEEDDKLVGGGDSSVHSSRFDNRDFDEEDELAFMDEPGYAVVVRRVTPGPHTDDVPKSLPRKKKQKRPSSKGNSLKRQQQPPNPSAQLPTGSEGGGNAFFSLPRFTPRTFHIVPPTRPHRNYSTLGPRRPPRDKKTKAKRAQQQPTDTIAGPSQQLQRPVTPLTPAASPASARSGSRPGSSMQGRPLPPPPRPERPVPLNNLDQATLERQALKGRHYANFEDEDLDDFEVHEELVIAKNISLLMDSDSALGSNNRIATSTSDINVAVQTDPLNEDEFELNIHDTEAFEDAHDRTDNKYSPRQPSDDASYRPLPPRPPPPTIQNVPPPQQPQQPIVIQPPEIVFPTRLHLDELQVDVLRVNNLTAGSLSLTQIIAPRLELNSMSSRGNLSVASITTPNLAVDQVDCSRVTAESADFPSIPPECFTSLLTDIRDAAASTSPTGDSSIEHSSPDKLEILKEEQCRLSAQQGDSASEPKKETTSTSADTPAVPTISTPAPRTVVRRTPSLRPSPSQASTAGDPDLEDIAQSGLRLGRALMRVTVRTLQAVSEYVEAATSNDPEVREKQRTNMKVLMCILMMFIVGILLVARSSSSEPRWQYLLPPQDM